MKERLLLVLLIFSLGRAAAFGEKRLSSGRGQRGPNTSREDESVAKRRRSTNPTGHIKLGATIGLDGLWGSTSSSDVLAKGVGYSFGLTAQIRIAGVYRLYFSPSYQFFRLGRVFDGSGQLFEPSPLTIEQSMKVVGLTLLGGYKLGDWLNPGSPTWWFDLGGEYLIPLSAEQTLGNSTLAFSGQKSFLLIVGPTAEFGVNPNLGLTGSFHVFYNLAGASAGRFFGVRLLGGATLKI